MVTVFTLHEYTLLVEASEHLKLESCSILLELVVELTALIAPTKTLNVYLSQRRAVSQHVVCLLQLLERQEEVVAVLAGEAQGVLTVRSTELLGDACCIETLGAYPCYPQVSA